MIEILLLTIDTIWKTIKIYSVLRWHSRMFVSIAGGGINSSQTEGATSDIRGEPGGR